MRPRPLALIILDGFGYREAVEHNAIAAANMPAWQRFWTHYPHTLISGSGRCVGLPHGQMGNSEVGHMNMGAGRVVHQDLTRIDVAIENGEFNSNAILLQAIKTAVEKGSALHIMGLLSPGGVHAHETHIFALIKLAAQSEVQRVYVHAFLDGRDTPPQSAASSLEALDALCQASGKAQIASICGRYYAMDRDKRWERVAAAYDVLVEGAAPFQAATALAGLEAAYARAETDEFVQPTAIHAPHQAAVCMSDGDVCVFMNFRADRAREITMALTDPLFSGFVRKRAPQLAMFVCLTAYDKQFDLPVAFAKDALTHLLTDCLSATGLKQLRLAETEKYAHVTFFFNGGVETPVEGEDRILISSPKVATYDLQPEMSAEEVTQAFLAAIDSQQYDVIICNFANPDMVGHTGNFAAAVQALEKIDDCLHRIIAKLQTVGGEVIITADHGNVEQMFDPQTGQPHTAHTSDPVPFVYIGRPAEIVKTDGKLSDIAPTMLYLLGLTQPNEMTGATILKLTT